MKQSNPKKGNEFCHFLLSQSRTGPFVFSYFLNLPTLAPLARLKSPDIFRPNYFLLLHPPKQKDSHLDSQLINQAFFQKLAIELTTKCLKPMSVDSVTAWTVAAARNIITLDIPRTSRTLIATQKSFVFPVDPISTTFLCTL